jgi:hypothetical protein
MSVIPANWDAEIRRIMVQAQPRQIVSKTLISSNKLSVVVSSYNLSHSGGLDRKMAV